MTALLCVSEATPHVPRARGPLSRWLLDAIVAGPGGDPPAPGNDVDPLVDDDLQLALYCCYELSYRGFCDAHEAAESDLRILQFRQRLENSFERALRDEHGCSDPAASVQDAVDQLLANFSGPSLSRYLRDGGDAERFCEFLVHRSAYQLKEADPHSWAIPRLPGGARKAALIEIQMDEYGGGLPGASHAELFADAMRSVGLDARYGRYLDVLPGVTLATCNLISMFGMHRRLTGAVLGHLAAFEMTSVEPMARYSATAMRLGMPAAVRRFYDVHVEADVHHGSLAHDALLGGDFRRDGVAPADVVFGVQALLQVEDRFARHLLDCWSRGASSLRTDDSDRSLTLVQSVA